MKPREEAFVIRIHTHEEIGDGSKNQEIQKGKEIDEHGIVY